MPLSEFRASADAVLQLQLLAVPGRSTKILGVYGNVAEEVEILENKQVETSVNTSLVRRLVHLQLLSTRKDWGTR